MERKCVGQVKYLVKVLERLDEAEALYGESRVYGALGKVGGAYTSLALAYAKGVIDKDEWKEISGALFRVRENMLKERDLKEVLDSIDRARKVVSDKMFEMVVKCARGD